MSKFRNPSNARYLKGLFFEETLGDKSTVLYTLKDSDHLGYPSLYRLYMEVNDPTEYRFAIQYLDGFEHWEMLTQCTWFQPYVSRWRNELEIRMKSENLAKLISFADTTVPNKDTLATNKYLLEAGWKPPATKGRPSKDQIKKAADSIAQEHRRIEEDFERIGKVN